MRNQEQTYPDGRSFPTIQQVELDTSLINNPPCQPIQRINLSNDCPLANTPETRIAGTCSQIV